MSHANRYVLDTNVWVDSYLDNRSGNKVARELITAIQNEGGIALYPVHVIKDVYYLIRSSLKREWRMKTGTLTESDAAAMEEAAWGCIKNMSDNASAVPADESDIWLAFRYHAIHRDFEDNLVLAAAERAQADMLVTNDRELIGKAEVPAHTPEDALKLLLM